MHNIIGFFRSPDFRTLSLMRYFESKLGLVRFVVVWDDPNIYDERLDCNQFKELKVISKEDLLITISCQFSVDARKLEKAAEEYKPLYNLLIAIYCRKTLAIDYCIMTDDDIFIFEPIPEIEKLSEIKQPFLVQETGDAYRIPDISALIKKLFSRSDNSPVPNKGNGYNAGFCGLDLTMFDEFKSEAFKEILELYLKLDVWYKGQAFFVSMIFAFSKSVHTFEKEKFLFMAWDDPRYRIKSKIYHCLATSDKSILDEFYKKNTVRSIFMLNRLLCRLSSVVLVIRKMIRRIRKSIYRHIYKLKEQQVPNAIRYHHLLEYLNQNHCNRILEIGVFRGETAKLMLQCSKNRNIEYHGIDLFEDGNSELAEKEMSLVADPMDVVLKKLKKHSEFVFLYKGYSTDVFLRIRDTDLRFDFIFIDGGHSYNTIRSDFENYSQLLSPDGIIFIDDYTKESLLPDVKKFIDDELLSNRQWDVNILDKWTDSYRGYNYKMVAVKFRVI